MALELGPARLAGVFGSSRSSRWGWRNVWMARRPITALRHCRGVREQFRLPAANPTRRLCASTSIPCSQENYAKKADTLVDLDYPIAWLSEDASLDSRRGKRNPSRGRRGAKQKQGGIGPEFTFKVALARGEGNSGYRKSGGRYSPSYSPKKAGYVMECLTSSRSGITKGTITGRLSRYVPMLAARLPMACLQPGTRTSTPSRFDMAGTLSSLLGINCNLRKAHGKGRVLTEALQRRIHSALHRQTLHAEQRLCRGTNAPRKPDLTVRGGGLCRRRAQNPIIAVMARSVMARIRRTALCISTAFGGFAPSSRFSQGTMDRKSASGCLKPMPEL